MASPTLPWIDKILTDAGHPPCAEIVEAGRRANPRLSWGALAFEISTKAGGTVSVEWVRKTFGHIDDLVAAEDIGGGDAA